MTFNDLLPIHASGLVAVGFIVSLLAYVLVSLAEYEEKREKESEIQNGHN